MKKDVTVVTLSFVIVSLADFPLSPLPHERSSLNSEIHTYTPPQHIYKRYCLVQSRHSLLLLLVLSTDPMVPPYSPTLRKAIRYIYPPKPDRLAIKR